MLGVPDAIVQEGIEKHRPEQGLGCSRAPRICPDTLGDARGKPLTSTAWDEVLLLPGMRDAGAAAPGGSPASLKELPQFGGGTLRKSLFFWPVLCDTGSLPCANNQKTGVQRLPAPKGTGGVVQMLLSTQWSRCHQECTTLFSLGHFLRGQAR